MEQTPNNTTRYANQSALAWILLIPSGMTPQAAREGEMSNTTTNENAVRFDDLGQDQSSRCRDSIKVSLAALGLVLCYLAFGAGCATSRIAESYTFDGSATAVRVDLEAGDVVVTGTDGDVTRVDVALECRGGTPRHRVDLSGSTLRVDARSGWAGEERCDGVVRIAIPRTASVEASVLRGDVAVADIDGRIDVETYEGDILYGSAASAVALKSETTDLPPSTGPAASINID
jgi:hypothetical protein